MANHLKKSMVLMIMAMLVMAVVVSAVRNLDEILRVNVDGGVVSINGTLGNPTSGCLNVKVIGVKPCGSVTAPGLTVPKENGN